MDDLRSYSVLPCLHHKVNYTLEEDPMHFNWSILTSRALIVPSEDGWGGRRGLGGGIKDRIKKS